MLTQQERICRTSQKQKIGSANVHLSRCYSSHFTTLLTVLLWEHALKKLCHLLAPVHWGGAECCVLGCDLMGVIGPHKTTQNSTKRLLKPLSCLQPPPLTHLLSKWFATRGKQRSKTLENECYEDASDVKVDCFGPQCNKEEKRCRRRRLARLSISESSVKAQKINWP